ncbi:hypothetical protein VTJ04DRAFT_9485 [Mycothermus thermophilus]|uniref:uncharacterized protein n=1 Tax=Humicola insolens TaxID=85995 RepID=UPI0037431E21
MNSPTFLAQRAVSTVCRSCRRSLLRQCQQQKRLHQQRQFATTPAAYVTAFQAYTLPQQQPPPPSHDSSVPTIPIDASLPPPPRTSQQKPWLSSRDIPETQTQQSTKSLAGLEEQQTQSQTTTPQPTQQSPAPAPAAAQPPSSTETATKPATRPRSKLRARKAAMTLTPAAVERLRALLDQPEPKLIKVGVRNRGCSGLAYHLEYVDKPGPFDETVEQDGVKVLIDSKALFSIIGSEMDWVEDKLSQRFVFRNPNIKEQCGCGESFMV